MRARTGSVNQKKAHAILITSYPPRNTLYGKGVGGLASFAKNTVTSMSRWTNFTILAEYFDKPEWYMEGQNEVIRCWKRGSPFLDVRIVNRLMLLRKKTSTLVVEFEFSIYGSALITGFFPAILYTARLLGFEINLVLHQVVKNFSELSPHLGVDPDSLKNKLIGALMKLYYKVLLFPTKRVIVLDEIHKEKLAKFTNINKVVVIPHGVDTRTRISRKKPPEGKFTLMTFGFLTWYKGSDWLIDAIANYLDKNPKNDLNLSLILAGGQSPTQKESPHYQKFYKGLENKVQKYSDHISITGFIPEEEIPDYFAKADLLIFPYRILMASSGPLSLAISHRRPFLISDVLRPYTRTNDFAETLKDLKLLSSSICFDLNDEVLLSKVEKLRTDSTFQKNLTKLAQELRKTRSWENLGKVYQKNIFPIRKFEKH